jgi:tripartite-type tricarboxylate transporter receptor subunit TctC
MTFTKTRRTAVGALAGAASLALIGTGPAHAQQDNWPSRPVTLVLPFPPGGSTDTVVRILAERLSSDLGQAFLVDNRTGAVGTIGMAYVGRAQPDGYTFAAVPGSTFAMAPHLYKLPYDTARDFTGVGLIASMPMLLVVPQSSPFMTFADFLEAAKRPDSNLAYGHGGVGSSIHLAAELFFQTAGVDLLGVSYRGMAPAVQGLLTGDTHMVLAPSSGLMGFLKAGNIRALAVSTKERSSLAPDVPTFAEQGFPGYEVVEEIAIFAPAGTPQPIVQRLNQAAAAAFAAPEVQERLTALAVVPSVSPVEDWPAHFASEYAKWGELIRTRNIKVE